MMAWTGNIRVGDRVRNRNYDFFTVIGCVLDGKETVYVLRSDHEFYDADVLGNLYKEEPDGD